MATEWFPLVDASGAVVGRARREACHGDPSLLHPVVHCLVRNRAGALLLQLRSADKDIQPGKWDTSVGGHIRAGESTDAALAREMAEEIGLGAGDAPPRFLYRYLHRSPVESELVHTYLAEAEGPFARQAEEIEALRFWTEDEIEDALGSSVFTPNFEEEYARYRAAVAGDAGGEPDAAG
jgi:isopentenyldiphosphate isomerase